MSTPRRSARLQAAAPELSSGAPAPPPHKRRKTAKSEHVMGKEAGSAGRKRTTKAPLNHLPLDVLFEVSGYLAPLDLIHLSRTTKRLRSIMLDRCMRPLWRNALAKPCYAGLEVPPECPEDVDEPAYVSLMFEHGCSICGNQRSTNTLIFAIRKRVCVDCYGSRQNFASTNMLLLSLGHKYAAIVEEHLTPINLEEYSNVGYIHKGTRYLAEDVKAVTASVKAHYGKKDAMTAFAAERQAVQQELQRRVDAAVVYEKWAMSAYWTRENMREDEIRNVRHARRQAILDRLAAAGHEDITDLLRVKAEPEYRPEALWRYFIGDSFVNLPKPLTDRTWASHATAMEKHATSIREIFVVRRRLDRLVRAHLNYIFAYNTAQPKGQPKRASDATELYTNRMFTKILHALIPDHLDHPDPAIDNADFGPVFDAFWASRGASHESRRAILARTLPRGVSLDSATVYFKCSRCRWKDVYSLPDALRHQCYTFYLPETDRVRIILKDMTDDVLPWNHGNVLGYDASAAKAATRLILLSGRDPKTATLADFTEGGVGFRYAHGDCYWTPPDMPLDQAVQKILRRPSHAKSIIVSSGSL